MSADPAFVKIAFQDSDGAIETLWAIDLGSDTYQLDSSPWFQYGISWKDIVEAVFLKVMLAWQAVMAGLGRTWSVRCSWKPVGRRTYLR